MIYDRRPSRPSFNPGAIPKLAYVVAAVMLLIMFGLWSLSRPSGAKGRLAEMERQAAIVKSAGLAEGDLRTYPLGSVCGGELNDNFRNQLSNALTNSGLAVDALDISAAGQDGIGHPLMAYAVTLKGTGTYEQAVSAMEIIAQYRPRLFLDSLSLRNNTSSVDLNVEGRLYCRWKKRG